MLQGDYDDYRIETIDKLKWSELWEDYQSEVKRFSSSQKRNIFGKEDLVFRSPDLTNRDTLNGYDRKLIGEFLRRHHARLAHEIGLGGLIYDGGKIHFGGEKLDDQHRRLAGIVARSHGMDIRDTFTYLQQIAHDSWRNPEGINIVFLMVVIRIADYIQIDHTRVNKFLLKMKYFSSPISIREHNAHLSVSSLNFEQPDSEKIYVNCNPENSELYVKVKDLITDIQSEFDKSWATMGEIYGFIPKDRPSIKFRRISSNLESTTFLSSLRYLPERVSFKVNNNLSKLLVAPLYGDNPTFGVRELLQNAIDACKERKHFEYFSENYSYNPKITISIKQINEEYSTFKICDNGKGMSEFEIINYFLNVGASFRKSLEWKKLFVSDEGKTQVQRNGKFGIGVLASFLLGEQIEVKTTHFQLGWTYSFKAEIETEFINIVKERDGQIEGGTTITIQVSNKKREKLLMHVRRWDEHSINWTNWFINDEPQIDYIVDDNVLEVEHKFDSTKFYSFEDENFQKIEWQYLRTPERSFHHYLAINGIMISDKYSPNSFVYSEQEKVFKDGYLQGRYRYVINDKPSLLITDKEGVFPIKLDRNEIDCHEMPFENELLAQVAQKFIIEILTLPVERMSIEDQNLTHRCGVIYSNVGYTLDFDYFIEGLKSRYNFIRVITENKKLSKDLSGFPNCLFHFQLNSKITLTYQESNIGTFNRTGSRVIIKRSYYDNLFHGNKKRLQVNLTKKIALQELGTDYVIYTTDGYCEQPVLLSSIGDMNKDLLRDCESIQEIRNEYFTTSGGQILNSLLKKYIKSNYIIPYDLKERRNLYKEAFAELKHFLP